MSSTSKIHHSTIIAYILFALYICALTELQATEFNNQPRLAEYDDNLRDGGSGPVMVSIPSGSFLMGDNWNIGKSYELPVHKVTIENKISISKFPITFNQFDKFTLVTNRKPADQYKWQRGKSPVINVNRDDAKAYIQWLSEQTNRTYRLPSEAEWEYAARAGSTTPFPWGNKIGVDNAHCKGCGKASIEKQTAIVGRYPPNNWGLHDMMGNVWEMTGDCWNYDYLDAPTDGTAWLTGNCTRLVLRGGSWGDVPDDLRSATRLRSYAKARTVNIGFRVARED